MKILIGSTSEQKISILKKVFGHKKVLEIVPCNVESGITDQPLDLDTTITGAINRAKNALKLVKPEDESFAIGLEGGLEMIDGLYSLICVAAIVDRLGRVAIGKSEFLPLPSTVSDRILSGEQFGVAIREFEKTLDKEKGIDLYAQILELISRERSFSIAISSAYKAFCNL